MQILMLHKYLFLYKKGVSDFNSHAGTELFKYGRYLTTQPINTPWQ